MYASRPTRTAHTLRTLVAALCILLVIFVGAAHLLHAHPGSEPASSNCGLCAVAHLAAIATPVLAASVTATALEAIRIAEPVSAPARFFRSDLYVRPPPALTAHA